MESLREELVNAQNALQVRMYIVMLNVFCSVFNEANLFLPFYFRMQVTQEDQVW